ncbi:MAG TPA: alpha/beta fold hydrolase [Marmoricola sp.]|jgi:triacylglycerol lipase
MGAFLRPPDFVGPQGLRALARETSAAVEAVRLVRRTREDRRRRAALPYADRHRRTGLEPVLLIPGFMAGDPTLWLLSAFLRNEGFRTYRSQIHVNVGCTRDAANRLERRLESIALRRGRKVSIVGHSLGGMLARGLAARRPDLVHGIVTMGSPVLAPGAVHTVLAWDTEMLIRLARAGFRGFMSEDCIAGACARTSFEDMQRPLDPAVGYTAIWSRRDGIVDPNACRDPGAECVEVSTSHCGMAVDPVVFDAVLKALRDQQTDVSPASRQAAPPA